MATPCVSIQAPPTVLEKARVFAIFAKGFFMVELDGHWVRRTIVFEFCGPPEGTALPRQPTHRLERMAVYMPRHRLCLHPFGPFALHVLGCWPVLNGPRAAQALNGV